MSRAYKLLTTLAIFMLLALAVVPSAQAFGGREGDRVVIPADEVVEDDLYIAAAEIVVDGTIKGDLYAGAQSVTINGTVEGDLVVGAQTVVINGTVTDDVRVFAMAIQVGPDAEIGDDLLFGGASLETRSGSAVGGDVVVGSAQALIAGDVAGNILAGTSALELSGSVEGDVRAYVDEATEDRPPMFYGPQTGIPIPSVSSGLTISDEARIGGSLTYTANQDLSIPASSVAGEVVRVTPQVGGEGYVPPTPPTPAELVGFWALDLLRTIITLIAVGLLLGWLFPTLIKGAGDKLQIHPWPSLGWGVVGYAAFYFTLLVVLFVMVLGAIIFGFLTLGSLSGAVIWLGLLTIFALSVGFVLTVAYVTKIVVSVLGGKLILARVKPELVDHKAWPLVVGVVVLATLMSIPSIGWLLKLLVVLFGLGALWLLGREKTAKQPTV